MESGDELDNGMTDTEKSDKIQMLRINYSRLFSWHLYFAMDVQRTGAKEQSREAFSKNRSERNITFFYFGTLKLCKYILNIFLSQVHSCTK